MHIYVCVYIYIYSVCIYIYIYVYIYIYIYDYEAAGGFLLAAVDRASPVRMLDRIPLAWTEGSPIT